MSDRIEPDHLPTVDDLLEATDWSARLAEARHHRAAVLAARAPRPPLPATKPWDSPEYLAAVEPRPAPVPAAPLASRPPLLRPAPRRRPILAAAAGVLVVGGLLSPGIAERMGLWSGGSEGTSATVQASLPLPPSRADGTARSSAGPAPDREGLSRSADPEGQDALDHPAASSFTPVRPAPRPRQLEDPPPSALADARAPLAPVASATPLQTAFPATPASQPPRRAPGSVRHLAVPALDPAPVVTRPTAPRIVVFLPDGAASSQGDALAALRDAGFDAAAPGRVGVRISRTHVRHYHAADLALAEEVAAAVGGEARDFTDFRPLPPPGTIELWLAGAPRAAPAVSRNAAPPRLPRFLQTILTDGRRQQFRIIEGDGSSAPITQRRSGGGAGGDASPSTGGRSALGTGAASSPTRQSRQSPESASPSAGRGTTGDAASRGGGNGGRGEGRGNGNARQRQRQRQRRGQRKGWRQRQGRPGLTGGA
jgi:hypothetical protein